MMSIAHQDELVQKMCYLNFNSVCYGLYCEQYLAYGISIRTDLWMHLWVEMIRVEMEMKIVNNGMSSRWDEYV